MERLLENLREWRFKLEVLILERMMEAELVGMQAEAAERVVAAAIFLVAHDGVTDILGMNADLVLAAGLQMEVDQRISAVAH